jgi:ribokinase
VRLHIIVQYSIQPKSHSPSICIVLHKGANYALPDPPARSDVGRHLTGISHLLLQNEIPWTTTLAYLELAHTQGIITIFNPSPLPTDIQLHNFPWIALSWLIVNEGEAEILLRVMGRNSRNDDAEEEYHTDWPRDNNVRVAFSTLSKLSRCNALASTGIVCTLGAKGVVASLSGLRETLYFPAAMLQGNVRDTTGAGDCFTGYFVAGLMHFGNKQLSQNEMIEILQSSVQVCLPRSK